MVKNPPSDARDMDLIPDFGTKIPHCGRPPSLRGASDGKESACHAGDLGSIPGSGRSLGEGKGNPLQYYCLENPHEQRIWRATANGVAKSQDMTKRLTHIGFKQVETGERTQVTEQWIL